MPLFSPDERGFADAVSRIVGCNPFLPERLEAERERWSRLRRQRGGVERAG